MPVRPLARKTKGLNDTRPSLSLSLARLLLLCVMQTARGLPLRTTRGQTVFKFTDRGSARGCRPTRAEKPHERIYEEYYNPEEHDPNYRRKVRTAVRDDESARPCSETVPIGTVSREREREKTAHR